MSVQYNILTYPDETVVTFETVVSDVARYVPSISSAKNVVAPPTPPAPQTDDDHCPSVHRHGMLWPMTKVGLKAVIKCPLGIGGLK